MGRANAEAVHSLEMLSFFPGLISSSTPARRSMQAKKTEMTIRGKMGPFRPIFHQYAYTWGLLAGEARQQPPRFPFSRAIPNDPNIMQLEEMMLNLRQDCQNHHPVR